MSITAISLAFLPSDLCDALDEETPNEEQTLLSDTTFGPVAARKVTEVVQTAVGILKSAIDYPRDFITDAARPGYWVPDSEISECLCCKSEFKDADSKHHWRACGMVSAGAVERADKRMGPPGQGV